MRANWQWDAFTDQVTVVADGEDIVVEGTWKGPPLEWIPEDNDTANNVVQACWNQRRSPVSDLGTLAVPREEHSAARALDCSATDLSNHVVGTGGRAPSKVPSNISNIAG